MLAQIWSVWTTVTTKYIFSILQPEWCVQGEYTSCLLFLFCITTLFTTCLVFLGPRGYNRKKHFKTCLGTTWQQLKSLFFYIIMILCSPFLCHTRQQFKLPTNMTLVELNYHFKLAYFNCICSFIDGLEIEVRIQIREAHVQINCFTTHEFQKVSVPIAAWHVILDLEVW